jgi:uncharacterized protein (DUF433 family)
MDAKKYPLIGSKPGGTSPAIAGTRIRVALIADICREIGEGPEAVKEITRIYDHLSAEQVREAISYWHDNEDAIEAEIRADERALQEIEANQPQPTRRR